MTHTRVRISVAVCAALMVLAGTRAIQADRDGISFVQQDKVVAFDPFTGIGAQTGTVSGDVTGVSIVNFQFAATPGNPNFTFNNRAGITDLNGDQVIFKNVGTGRFIAGLQDPTLPGNTPPFQVFGNGIGATLRGTYEVVAASGRFSLRFHLGDVFRYRAIAYNPSTPPTVGGLGSVYVEVSGFDHDQDQ